MPLYIRDDDVDALAVKYQKVTGAKNKTEAVRRALQLQIAALAEEKPLMERIYDLQARADAIGEVDPDFNLKKFSDDLWETD